MYVILVLYMEYQEKLKIKSGEIEKNGDTSQVNSLVESDSFDAKIQELNQSLYDPDSESDWDEQETDEGEGSKNSKKPDNGPKLRKFKTIDERSAKSRKNLSARGFKKFWKFYTSGLQEKWEDKNIAEKGLYFLEYPFHLLM